MKKNLIIIAACLFTVISSVAVFLSGCNKADQTYYHYSNNAGTFNGNTFQYLQSQNGVYDSLILVLNRISNLANEVKQGSVTLFAANNQSFALALQNINQARKDSIPSMPPVTYSTIDSALLDTFLCRYIIPGKQTTDSLKGFTDGKLYASFHYGYNMQLQYVATNASGYLNGGPKAITFSDPKNSIFTRNWTRVNTITVDIKTANGIIHLLPPGHDFGFGNEFIRKVNKR